MKLIKAAGFLFQFGLIGLALAVIYLVSSSERNREEILEFLDGSAVTQPMPAGTGTAQVSYADAVRTALQANKGDLLIRAKDSRGRGEELAHVATALGCATATWGTKASLGDAFSRSELGVLLVMDRGIALAILDCLSHIEALSEDG